MAAISLLGTPSVSATTVKPVGSVPTPKGAKPRAVVDKHRHVVGPKLAAKMAAVGLYNPKLPFPQINPLDFVCHRDFVDLDYAMPKQRKAGVTMSVASNGGEIEWIAHDLLRVSTGEAIKFMNDEYLAASARFPGEFALMANAHALEESCRPIVEAFITKDCGKPIAVSSSYGDGAGRTLSRQPKAEWLWEDAAANGLVVHIHPPMLSIGHEARPQ